MSPLRVKVSNLVSNNDDAEAAALPGSFTITPRHVTVEALTWATTACVAMQVKAVYLRSDPGEVRR